MTKTLTEQWRDGKLPNGDYYIKVRGNLTGKEFFVYDNCINGKWAYTLDGNVIAVISPVPNYDEYNELATKCNQLQKRLEIATRALKKYESAAGCGREAFLALKEMEGVK